MTLAQKALDPTNDTSATCAMNFLSRHAWNLFLTVNHVRTLSGSSASTIP
jgi:hypothetical protein